MVMRNRNDSADTRRGWDDMPPRFRNRVSEPPAHQAETENAQTHEPGPLVSASELVLDLSRLALLFFIIAVGNMIFLILALSFINGN